MAFSFWGFAGEVPFVGEGNPGTGDAPVAVGSRCEFLSVLPVAVGVVAVFGESGAEGELQPPALCPAQRQGISVTQAQTPERVVGVLVAGVVVEGDVEAGNVGMQADEMAPQGLFGPPADLGLHGQQADVAPRGDVVGRVPHGNVERPVGAGADLDAEVGDQRRIEQQVGLGGDQPLSAAAAFFGDGGKARGRERLFRDAEKRGRECGFGADAVVFRPLVDDDHAGIAQRGKEFADDLLPGLSAVEVADLPFARLVVGGAAEDLQHFVALRDAAVGGKHAFERRPVLAQVVGSEPLCRKARLVPDEPGQGIGAPLAQAQVPVGGAFGRGTASDPDVGQPVYWVVPDFVEQPECRFEPVVRLRHIPIDGKMHRCDEAAGEVDQTVGRAFRYP